MEARLAYDICRCHDVSCPLKDKCLRFVCRGDAAWRLVAAPTLRNADGSCDARIPFDPEAEEYVKR
jgi:hypothetical protein